jgi:hypothetical protein
LVLLKLDFTKAYDKIPWNNIFEVIDKVGMDLIFINMVCIIFNNKKTPINAIGALTKFFQLYGGVTRLSLGAILIHFVGKAFNHMIKKVMGRG